MPHSGFIGIASSPGFDFRPAEETAFIRYKDFLPPSAPPVEIVAVRQPRLARPSTVPALADDHAEVFLNPDGVLIAVVRFLDWSTENEIVASH